MIQMTAILFSCPLYSVNSF